MTVIILISGVIVAMTESSNREERAEFASFLAANPEAGDVIPGSGGCRKIRWTRYMEVVSVAV